jgi:hypothetical protein
MATEFRIQTAIAAIDRISRPVRRISALVSTRLAGAFRATARAAGRATLAIARAGVGLTKYAAGAASLGAAAAFKIADSHARAADSMAKLARRSGITVEAYQELRHAADLSGVSQDQFDSALVRFTRTMGEAKGGMGALHSLLQKNAPAFLEQLKTTESQTEALDLMLAAMGKIEDPTVRAALASAAFGRAGQQMTLMFENGAEGLATARQEAHDLGMVLDDTAATQAENYVDAMARLRGSVAGVTQALGAKLVPVLADTIDTLRGWVTENRELIGQNLDRVFSTIGDVLDAIDWQAITDGIMSVVEEIRPFAEDVVQTIRDNWGPISDFFSGLFRVLVASARGAIAVFRSIWEGLKVAIGPIFAGIKSVFTGFSNFLEGVFSGNLDLVVKGLEKMWNGFKTFFVGLWNGLKTTLSGTLDAIGKLFDKIAPEPLKKAWSAMKGFFTNLWSSVTGIFDRAVDKIFGWVKDLKGAADDVLGVGERVAMALGLSEGVEVGSAMDVINARMAAAQAGAAGAPGELVAPAAPVSTLGAGAELMKTTSDVVVTFRNAPAELAVSSTRTDGPGTVKTNVGRRQAGAGAP